MNMKLATLLTLFATAAIAFTKPEPRPGFDWSGVGQIAVQDRGRIKPLDTFATESLQFITGNRTWKGMSAVEVLFGWLIAYDKEWEYETFIRIDHNGLKQKLGFREEDKYFSPKELEQNQLLAPLVREAMQKEQRKERASDLDKKVLQIQNQRGLLESILTGRAWTMLPNPQGLNKDWFSLSSLGDQNATLPYEEGAGQKLTSAIKLVLSSFMARNASDWNPASAELARVLRFDLAPSAYPEMGKIQREIHYNHLHPFRIAWISYVVAFIALMTFLVTKARPASMVGAGALGFGFLVHAYGFVLRCLIAGRPPVTNMYESVIWVTWGCVLFSLLIWLAYRNATIPTASVVFAIVGLVLADNLPVILDSSINPLEPVLRSNYWLTIHVLTITMSYAAFALSLCLGNVVLGNYFFRASQTAIIQQYTLYMYRAMQIGVVLLAAGTILGGIWADYSWGRFWGWDPKEVWALIALLLYLAVLHGRFTGWLKGFGFAATTVVSFLGVLMAWYGVNFVLGVGLHSYGFGTGGMGYVLGYVLLQVGFIVAAYVRYAKFRATLSHDPAIFPR